MHLQAIIAMEALESRMKGTTLYGRRAMLAIANPRMATKREISGNPDERRAVTYKSASHTAIADR